MNLQGWIHNVARRLGFDVYNHMAGGRRFPFRVWTLPSVGPFQPHSRPFHGSLLALGAAGVDLGFEVDLEQVTSFLGFSYSYSELGWNPHVATLQEFVRNPTLTYEESSLYQLHQLYQPATLQDVFLEDEPAEMKPLSDLPPTRSLFRYIWAVSPALIRKTRRHQEHKSGHHYFGPLSEEKGRAQFDRLVKTYQSIEREGFLPEKYGPVMGYLMADETTYRFVVGSGNHRLAALKVLGHTTVPVRLTKTHPAVVHRDRLDSWTIDKGGPFERDTAYALFDKLLHEGGLQKARNIGVVGLEGHDSPRR
jgi:hypothetical protein